MAEEVSGRLREGQAVGQGEAEVAVEAAVAEVVVETGVAGAAVAAEVSRAPLIPRIPLTSRLGAEGYRLPSGHLPPPPTPRHPPAPMEHGYQIRQPVSFLLIYHLRVRAVDR